MPTKKRSLYIIGRSATYPRNRKGISRPKVEILGQNYPEKILGYKINASTGSLETTIWAVDAGRVANEKRLREHAHIRVHIRNHITIHMDDVS